MGDEGGPKYRASLIAKEVLPTPVAPVSTISVGETSSCSLPRESIYCKERRSLLFVKDAKAFAR